MAKVKGKLSNNFCPQPLYLCGTYQEDGTPHFGLFCWFGWCWLGEGDGSLGAMVCIGEEKTTKDLIRKNGVFSANLAGEALLPLADYYGCTSGRENPDKMKRLPTVEPGQVLPVPTIAESPVSVELKVLKEEALSQARLNGESAPGSSSLFLCQAVNVTIEEGLTDQSVPFLERLAQAAPVITSGEERYVTLDGRDLGGWGEPQNKN